MKTTGFGILDRRPQQPVGVGGRRGHDDGEAGDVGQQRLEALRVLAARGAAGAELGAHRQAHLGRAAGHERQLGRLVEQLVQADAEEVEVHDLDDRAHARHGRSDGEPDDRRLRDGGVADPVAEAFAQAAGEPEHVAALAHVDAGDEHAVVALELGLERGADGVHGAELRRFPGRRRRLGDRRPFPDDEVEEGGRRGGATACAPARRPRRARSATDFSSASISASLMPAIEQPLAVEHKRVTFLPRAQLLRRAVALRVALVVAVPAVGGRLDDDRARTRPARTSTASRIVAAVATTSLPSTE